MGSIPNRLLYTRRRPHNPGAYMAFSISRATAFAIVAIVFAIALAFTVAWAAFAA